jgi:anti-sigma-K factor RskA
MMNLSAEQFEELLVAYALDALEPEERALVEAQLAATPDYNRQLVAYEEMLAGLAALSPTVTEPVGHRERMMARLAAAPQGAATPPPLAQATPVALPAVPPATLTAQPARRPAPHIDPAPQPGFIERLAGWFSAPGRISVATTAAALVLVIGMIFWNLSLQGSVNTLANDRDQVRGQMTQLTQQATQLQQQLTQTQGDKQALQTQLQTAQQQLGQFQTAENLLGQPGTVVKALPSKDNQPAFSQFIANDSLKQAVLFAYNMQPVSASQTYEFWLVPKQGNPIPAGTFNVKDDGKGVLNVNMPKDVPMGNLAAGAITVEPAGGLPQPSGQMVIVGNF